MSNPTSFDHDRVGYHIPAPFAWNTSHGLTFPHPLGIQLYLLRRYLDLFEPDPGTYITVPPLTF